MKKPWLDHEKEKRKHPRLEHDASVEVHKENFGGSQEGHIHDISSSGIRITTELSINENEDIVIHLHNPKTKQHVSIIGEVCWLEDTSESRVQAGIQFHPLDGHSVAKLKQLMVEVSGDPAWGDTKPQHFADTPTLEEEISKILEDPGTETDTPAQELTSKSVHTINEQNPSLAPKKSSSSSVRFLTLLLFLLFTGLAGGTWWLQQQNQEHLSISKAKEAVSVVIKDGGWLEQDIEPGQPSPDTPIVAEAALPDTQTTNKGQPIASTELHAVNSTQGIQNIGWSGDPTQLSLTISFDQLPAGTTYQIQKLDFDPNNVRYLIKIPVAQSKLEQNEFILDHPLVEQVRIGIHSPDTNPSLHLVLDMKKAKGEIVSDRIQNNQLILKLVSFE